MIRSKSFLKERPLLYLVATPIGNLKDFSPRAKEILASADLIACEDTRVTSSLLAKFDIHTKLISCYSQIEKETSLKIVDKMVDENLIVAFVSDAGYPGISDPGNEIVFRARERNIPVSIIGGPTAFLSTLVATPFSTSRFIFIGFLKTQLSKRSEELASYQKAKETLIFYEAPHRIKETLAALYASFGNRRFVIGRELTKLHEEYILGTLEEAATLDYASLIGEMVVVIEGNLDEEQEIDETELRAKLIKLISLKVSKKDAVSYLSEELQINKNILYNIAKTL